jgi:hypothetical protein
VFDQVSNVPGDSFYESAKKISLHKNK